MSIFQVDQVVEPAAQQLAKGFLAEANQQFDREVAAAYDAVQRFWFRNLDADGNPSPIAQGQTPEPTGPEILEAMGTDAQGIITIAYSRVQMLLNIQTAFGVNVIDQTKLTSPYDLVFNADGSLQSATLKT